MNAQELVRSWRSGRARHEDGGVRFAAPAAAGPAARLRRAYDWITAHAVHAPFHDVDLAPPAAVGPDGGGVTLPRGECYASFVLLPLLNLLTSRRVVFVGGPGRGKTTM